MMRSRLGRNKVEGIMMWRGESEKFEGLNAGSGTFFTVP